MACKSFEKDRNIIIAVVLVIFILIIIFLLIVLFRTERIINSKVTEIQTVINNRLVTTENEIKNIRNDLLTVYENNLQSVKNIEQSVKNIEQNVVRRVDVASEQIRNDIRIVERIVRRLIPPD